MLQSFKKRLSYLHIKLQTVFPRNKVLYELIQNILNSLDDELKVAEISADLSKAFDLVHHSILPSKLQYYGIRGDALLLLTPIPKQSKREGRSPKQRW